jgi:hypothetical protein
MQTPFNEEEAEQYVDGLIRSGDMTMLLRLLNERKLSYPTSVRDYQIWWEYRRLISKDNPQRLSPADARLALAEKYFTSVDTVRKIIYVKLKAL